MATGHSLATAWSQQWPWGTHSWGSLPTQAELISLGACPEIKTLLCLSKPMVLPGQPHPPRAAAPECQVLSPTGPVPSRHHASHSCQTCHGVGRTPAPTEPVQHQGQHLHRENNNVVLCVCHQQGHVLSLSSLLPLAHIISPSSEQDFSVN